MGSIPGPFPISLRTWPSKDDNAVPLSSLISRINNERGDFRDVTEESLIEELRRDEAGSDRVEDDESVLEDVGDEPDRSKELMIARGEILGQLEEAHNAAAVTLDFVSLLLSKDTPIQASLSISQQLRESVPLGTLGVDKIQNSRVTKAQRHDDRRIAKGWKLQGLVDTVDSILASATRLEKEIESETKYWEQILAVSENGWAICRLPKEKHTLGVRFGFAESAPALNSRSLGALRRNVDGTVFLDQGILDSTPRQVRVRIQTNGVTTGESSLFEPVENPSFIGSSISIARNSIFEEELWQELNREARVLANQGVRVIKDEIVCGMKVNQRIVLDLQDAEDNGRLGEAKRLDGDDAVAEMISLSLRLLLSFAHRQNHHHRSQPPPSITSHPPSRPSYNLLRPVIMRFHHEALMTSLIGLLNPLSRALISAGVCDSAPSVTTELIASAIAKAKSAKHPFPLPERTIDALVSFISAEVTLPLTKPPLRLQSLTIQVLTSLPALETRFRITVVGPLAVDCKPPPNPSTVDEVKGYVLWAASCALAGAFADASEDTQTEEAIMEADQVDAGSGVLQEEVKGEGEDRTSGLRDWQPTNNPTILRKSLNDDMESKELTFKVTLVAGERNAVKIKAVHKYFKRPQAVEGESSALTHVWSSEDREEQEQEHMHLSRWVESVGKWSKAELESTYRPGDGYDFTSVEWA